MQKYIKKFLCAVIAASVLASTFVFPISVYAFTEISEGFDYNAATAVEEMTNNGWTFPADPADKGFAITDGKLKVPTSWMYKAIDVADLPSGFAEIKFSVTPKDTTGRYVVAMRTNCSYTGANGYFVIIQFYEGKIYGQNLSSTNVWHASNVLASSYTADATYDVTVKVDIGSGSYTVDVELGDASVGSYTYTFPNENEYPLTIYMMQSGATGAGMLVDDLSVRAVDEGVSYKSYSESFDSTTIAKLNADGWNITSAITDANLVDGTLQLGYANDSIYRPLNIPANEIGKYEIKFSVTPEDTLGEAVFYFTSNYSEIPDPTRTDGWNYQHFLRAIEFYKGSILKPRSTAYSFFADRTTGVSKVGSYKDGHTYDVEIVYNVGKEYSATITEKDETGAATGTVYTYTYSTYFDNDVNFASYGTEGEAYLAKLYMQGVKSATTQSDFFVDNFSIRKIISKPSASALSVVMTDVKGNSISPSGAAVTPALDKIELTFGTDMITRTMKSITFTDEDGNTVAGTPTYVSKNGVYAFDIDGVLKPNSSYSITIPATVENVENVTMGEAYVYTFETGVGEYLVEIEGLYKTDETEITQISDINNSETVNVKVRYINTTDKKESLVAIISCYNNNMLIPLAPSVEKEVDEFSADVETISFTMPADMSKVTDLKIFVWDTAVDAVGLCDAVNPFVQ